MVPWCGAVVRAGGAVGVGVCVCAGMELAREAIGAAGGGWGGGGGASHTTHMSTVWGTASLCGHAPCKPAAPQSMSVRLSAIACCTAVRTLAADSCIYEGVCMCVCLFRSSWRCGSAQSSSSSSSSSALPAAAVPPVLLLLLLVVVVVVVVVLLLVVVAAERAQRVRVRVAHPRRAAVRSRVAPAAPAAAAAAAPAAAPVACCAPPQQQPQQPQHGTHHHSSGCGGSVGGMAWTAGCGGCWIWTWACGSCWWARRIQGPSSSWNASKPRQE